jgi:hypothetical protein
MVEELTLDADDGVRGDVDDGAHQVVLVLEVVVELTTAGTGALPDVVEAHAGGSALGDEPGGGLQDPLARRLPFPGRGGLRHT